MSRMGLGSAEVAGVVGIVALERRVLHELVRGTHQPHPPLMGGVQVLRHALAVAKIGDLQLVAERRSK